MPAYRTSAAGGSSSGTSNRTAIITPAVGDLLLVFCSVDTNTNSTPTCSDNNGSGTYDRIAAVAFGASAHRGSCFVRTALMANTTSTTVTVATGSNTAGEVVIVAVSGMAKAGIAAIRSSGTQANQAAAGTPAPALNQAALTGNATIGAVFNSTNPATMTTPSGWTERQDVGQTSNAVGLEVVTRDSGFTGTTVTWGSTSASAFGSAVVELDGSNSGTLSSTIAAITSNPDATGAVHVQGAESATIDAVTGTGTGGVIVQGAESSTIDAVTIVADGTVSSGPSGITGTLDATIDPITSSATGVVIDHGATGATIDPVTVAATSAVHVSGAASDTIAAVTSSAAGAVHVSGTAAATVPAVTGTETGTVKVQGAASTTIDAPTLAATVGESQQQYTEPLNKTYAETRHLQRRRR